MPTGRFTLSFVKSGYRAATMTDFEVQPGSVSLADFPLQPLPASASEDVLELDAFVVEASQVGEMLTSLELRMESDVQLDVLSAETFGKKLVKIL